MKKPEEIESQVKQSLDASVEGLPKSVRDKLAAARHKALQAAAANKAPSGKVTAIGNAKASPKQAKQWSKPVWAMAASLCVMVPLWYASQNLTGPTDQVELVALDVSTIGSPLSAQSTTLSALDIMSTLAELNDEEMELLDNLEFALWLSEQEQASAHG